MRKKNAVTITTDGRDKGKTFLVTEHDVFDAEDWAINALRLAQRSGVDIPGGVQAGMSGIAAIGILTVLGSATSMDELSPLLATMMREVKIITDQKTQFTRPLVADDPVVDFLKVWRRHHVTHGEPHTHRVRDVVVP